MYLLLLLRLQSQLQRQPPVVYAHKGCALSEAMTQAMTAARSKLPLGSDQQCQMIICITPSVVDCAQIQAAGDTVVGVHTQSCMCLCHDSVLYCPLLHQGLICKLSNCVPAATNNSTTTTAAAAATALFEAGGDAKAC
eukprot:1685-Heterococcus_DN1.PRE.1